MKLMRLFELRLDRRSDNRHLHRWVPANGFDFLARHTELMSSVPQSCTLTTAIALPIMRHPVLRNGVAVSIDTGVLK